MGFSFSELEEITYSTLFYIMINWVKGGEKENTVNATQKDIDSFFR